MSDRFWHRQLLTAALTANAIRPLPGRRAAVPAMFTGWLTSELAPHLLTATAADALVQLTRGRDGHRERAGLSLAAASLTGLGFLVAQAEASRGVVDRALAEALGEDYAARLGPTDVDLDLGTPWQQLAMPFRIRYAGVEVDKNIVYAGGGSPRGMLDVYRPARAALHGAPVLLQVHGGAWSVGSKDQQGIPLMLHMAARGWVCVAINYRLSPGHAFPTHLIDVKRSLAWVRETIEAYGGDPSYVAITGGSAGGHLAALAALTPSEPEYQPGFEDADTTVQAAAPHYGVYDLAAAGGDARAVDMRDRFLGPRVLMKDPYEHLVDFERASPVLRVGRHAPPFFVVHGTNDSLVPVSQARQFVGALREVSTQPVAYAELPGAQHAFDVFPSIRSAHVVRGVERFLRWSHTRWRESRPHA